MSGSCPPPPPPAHPCCTSPDWMTCLEALRSKGRGICNGDAIQICCCKPLQVCTYTSVCVCVSCHSLIRYECCEGYQQLGRNNGCTAVKPLKNILETAEELGARRSVIHIHNYTHHHSHVGTYTAVARFSSHAGHYLLHTYLYVPIQH